VWRADDALRESAAGRRLSSSCRIERRVPNSIAAIGVDDDAIAGAEHESPEIVQEGLSAADRESFTATSRTDQRSRCTFYYLSIESGQGGWSG
jgi:hypothetical protein